MTPQELLKIAQHHCQAILAIIDQLTENKFTQRRRVAMADAGARRSQLSIRRDWWDLGSMFRRPRSKTARASVVGMPPRRFGQERFVPLSGPMDRGP
jgi:hypothetical protein